MDRVLTSAAKQASTIRSLYGKTEDQYLELLRGFPLRPLRSDADLDAAIAMIDSLIDRTTTAMERRVAGVESSTHRNTTWASMTPPRPPVA